MSFQYKESPQIRHWTNSGSFYLSPDGQWNLNRKRHKESEIQLLEPCDSRAKETRLRSSRHLGFTGSRALVNNCLSVWELRTRPHKDKCHNQTPMSHDHHSANRRAYPGCYAKSWASIISLNLHSNTVRFAAGKPRFQVPCLRPPSQQVAAAILLQTQGPWKVWAVCTPHEGAQGSRNVGLKYSPKWWTLALTCYPEDTRFQKHCTYWGITRPPGDGMIPQGEKKKICSGRPRCRSLPARYFLPDCPPPVSPLRWWSARQ